MKTNCDIWAFVIKANENEKKIRVMSRPLSWQMTWPMSWQLTRQKTWQLRFYFSSPDGAHYHCRRLVMSRYLKEAALRKLKFHGSFKFSTDSSSSEKGGGRRRFPDMGTVLQIASDLRGVECDEIQRGEMVSANSP